MTGAYLVTALAAAALLTGTARGESVALDASAVRPGAVRLEAAADSVVIQWPDEASGPWRAEFSLDPAKPLITAVGPEGKTLIERARPLYWCSTGKRRGGWDQFFDLPPSHPEGTRSYTGAFRLTGAKARTVGDRLEILFDGLQMGIFRGGIRYTFYPGSRLLHQEAVVRTSEPDTAYYYDAGLALAAEADRRAGNNMESRISYYDTEGRLRSTIAQGPERTPLAVRYRTAAARLAGGSLAVFPPPHQYFFPRDFTTNMGHLWHSGWRGTLSMGIRQLPDDNTRFYPWINAPPESDQRLGIFFLLSDGDPAATLEEVLRFSNRDRFERLEGYKTVSVHWHFAYTVQAMEKGFDWTPPFKPVLEEMGVDANIIMDFHGDGHPADVTELRLQELEAFFQACRKQSDENFLLIPSEEANVHLGGHWSLIFPKPVYWFMKRPEGTEFVSRHPKYGTVYRTGNAEELLEMVRREGGYMYQTHPRTKGSMGFPDKIRETEHFRDPRYLGAGWKAMNADLSSPRMGDRSLNLLDDMNNWGLRKRLLGEVDVFQIDPTHELWGHMNVNYVRLDRLPAFDQYGSVLEAVANGDFFVTTGEVLLPAVKIQTSSADQIVIRADVQWRFPLQFAEIVWGDGETTSRKLIPLATTRPFGSRSFEWNVEARGWKWARLAVWDVASNGAFVNPVWR